NGVVWVATNDGILVEINTVTNEVQADSLNSKDSVKLQIRQIMYESNRVLVATSKGLYAFDLADRVFRLLETTADLEINTFAKDKNDHLWLGTMRQGLKKMAIKGGEIITPDAGNLPFTLIDKIVIGKDNELWLSTQDGIYLLDKSVQTHAEGSFKIYNKEDGLVFNSFYLHGFISLPDGTLLLGQKDKYYHIRPGCLREPKTIKPVYLTSFQILGNTTPTPIQQLKNIELGPDENFFNIYFSSLTYCQADKVRFTYKMEGLDKDWIITNPGQNHQNYTKLDAGKYTFRIHRIGFTEDEQQLEIVIHPPIWLSTGAYILYALLGLGALFGIYRFQLKRQLERQESQNLKEIDAVKNKAYANITHEFRTPLTLILGLSEQLQKLNLGEIASQKIAGIRNNGNRILSLVNQILDLRKIESGKFQIKLVQKEIVPLLEYAGQNVKPLAIDKNIKLEQNIEFDSLIMDHDADNLISVISNLLDNAIKFTPEGGTVSYAVKQDNKQLLIEVADSGKGINPEDLPKIFDRYVGTNAPNYTSTGIGLSLTKALVELMGGKIEVQSTIDKGSKFTVTLPITQKAAKAEIEKPLLATLAVSKPITLPNQVIDTESDKPIVLIVEDNLEIAQMVGAIFDDKYQLTFAMDGKEGLDKAMEIIPDLIISDVMMPLMDGFELCESLKADKLTSHIPIILLTAKVTNESKIAGLKRGADAYLTKPINQPELLLSVHNALQNRTALKAHYYAKFTEQVTETIKVFNPIEGIDFDIEDAFYQQILAVLAKKSHDVDYTIIDLRADLKVSKTQLNRKLKSIIGLTTGNTLKFFRFHKARILLKTTSLNITEVAFQAGFKDPSYFTRTFKAAYKITPTNFRESGDGNINGE
ncbi:MAG: ATP-binding protein, partial [Saprospiraceae bacterium]